MSVSSKKVAARAGVSQATVSRVINHNPGVREETRRRVQQAIEELGYVPNAEARSLVTQRTMKIGLIVSDIVNPFYPELVESVEESARNNGYAVLLCNTQRDPSIDEQYAQLLIEQRVAGAILAAVTTQSQVPTLFSRAQIPCVFINRYQEETLAPSVYADNVAGAYAAIEYLIELGHTRIAFVRGSPEATTSLDRELGYRQCLSDHGLEVDDLFLERGDYTRVDAYGAATRLLKLAARPTAIFCANDYMAFGVLDAAFDLGLGIPDDLSVIGFDDIALSSLRGISLTTIEQPIGEMARRATEILLGLINSEVPLRQPFSETYEPKLIVRSTTGKVPK